MILLPQIRLSRTIMLLAVVALSMTGCGLLPADPMPGDSGIPQLPNPIRIPVADHELAWNTIIDTVDDYFEIVEESRVKSVGGTLTDGYVVTNPQIGSGIQEFWQKDSTPGFERWQSTFQTIRRQANLRVTPVSGGYDVEIVVSKELEDLDRPEQAAIGQNLRRHDGTIVRQSALPQAGSLPLGWVPLGRDHSLEQTILADIQTRFVHVAMPADIQLLPPVHPPIDFRH